LTDSIININGVEYQPVCSSAEIKDGCGIKHVTEDFVEIAVIRYDGKLYALSNICPHSHQSRIHEGLLLNGVVSCPAHGWTFRLENGSNTANGAGLDTYKAFEQDGIVYIEKKMPKAPKWKENL
jgi:nitrite reductase/ring-hydroxylating ferredoxin subunit